MSNSSTTVTVKILDREYQVSCPEDERTALEQSARFLDQRMNSIRNSGNVLGIERIAVMAALNITHELLQRQNENNDLDKNGLNQEAQMEMKNMEQKLDIALQNHRQLKL